jgi:hypothetical protein
MDEEPRQPALPVGAPPSFLSRANRVLPDLTRSALAMLVTVPLPWAQVCVPGLEKYTQQDLQGMLSALFTSPPPGPVGAQPVALAWGVAEDFVLLAYLHSGQTRDVLSFLEDLGAVLHPTRTRDDIQARLAFLAGSEAARDGVVERWSKECACEERLFRALTQQDPRVHPGRIAAPQTEVCACVEWAPPAFALNPAVAGEIASLKAALDDLASNIFEDGDLAVLRADSMEFLMRDRILVIGRGTKDAWPTVNLGFLSDAVCPHVSREHACIQLMPDGQFYIENIGSTLFRVNGKIIRPRKYGGLPPASVLDFAGLVLVFIPNRGFVNRILEDAQSSHEKT